MTDCIKTTAQNLNKTIQKMIFSTYLTENPESV